MDKSIKYKGQSVRRGRDTNGSARLGQSQLDFFKVFILIRNFKKEIKAVSRSIQIHNLLRGWLVLNPFLPLAVADCLHKKSPK